MFYPGWGYHSGQKLKVYVTNNVQRLAVSGPAMCHSQSFLQLQNLESTHVKSWFIRFRVKPGLCGFNKLPITWVGYLGRLSCTIEGCDGLLWTWEKTRKALISFLPQIFSYTGSRPTTNMVITDVKMISGFIPLKPTVKMVGLLYVQEALVYLMFYVSPDWENLKIF